MAFFDDVLGALGPTAGGAAAGSAFGPWGAAIGGGIGLLGGVGQARANSGSRNSMAQAREDLRRQSQESYERRMRDLEAAMKYFQPVNAQLERLYGSQAVPPTPMRRG